MSTAWSIIARIPVRMSGWSSAMPTRTITFVPRTAVGLRRGTPPPRPEPGFEVAAVDRRPFSHSDKAVPWLASATGTGPMSSGSLVIDHDAHSVVGVSDSDSGSRPTGMLDDVCERLLHDAIRGEIDARRNFWACAFDAEPRTVTPDLHYLGDQRI